ncbi:hypothetical protein [Nautilia sp.]
MRISIILIISVFLYSKILIVNSYDEKDPCGIPQLNGFLSQMYEKNFKAENFDILFLNARVTPKKTLLKKASEILNDLKKYDYVITFDDAAFQLIGIPASKKQKPVFFSGINIPFKVYEKKYVLNKSLFGGVYEKLYVKEVLNTFNKITPVKKIAFFYSRGIGELIKKQVTAELNNTEYENKIAFIKCETIKELKEKVKKTNNVSFTLFMPFTLSLKKEGKKVPLYTFKDIYLKNIKKPDISINRNFTKMGFLGFGGVDFFEMGKSTANIFLNYLKTKKPQIINAPKAYYFINVKRAKQINFKLPEWFIKNYVKDIIW